MSRDDSSYVMRLIPCAWETLPRHSWWPRHVQSMTGYFEAARSGEEEKVRVSRDLVVGVAAEWDHHVPVSVRKLCRKAQKSHGRMLEHARLERAIVDAALLHD